MKDDSDFKWLPGYEPERAVHRAQTRLEIAAPARAIWDVLIDAKLWPNWFTMSKDVILPDGKAKLGNGMPFKWAMQGVRFTSAIYQFDPCRRLSWRSSNPLISTCHIWAFEERDGSTTVITDETQRGPLPTLLSFLVRPKLKKGQQLWLDALAARTAEVPLSAKASGLFGLEARHDNAA